MDINRNLKIKKQLLEQEIITYASDRVVLPEGGIDCSEGCNPYGFPTECAEALRNFDTARLGAYPHSQALYDAIREYWKDQADIERENIRLADGSINALYIVNTIFDTHDAVVLGVSPQFTDYYIHAEMIGIEYVTYQLERANRYRFIPDDFIRMFRQTGGGKPYNYIYLDNPNNPTGQCLDLADIERIVDEANRLNITIIIDEAYGDFMDKSNSAINLCEKYHNLVVVRTMSKGFGLAGMRVGYIIAARELIGYMDKVANPYMVGELSREIAAAALGHDGIIEKSKTDFARMKGEIRRVLGCTAERPEGGAGRLHLAETLDTNSLLLLYHDDPDIRLKDEFFRRGVLVIDGYDFKGLDSSAARVRLPVIDEFPVLIRAIEEINAL